MEKTDPSDQILRTKMSKMQSLKNIRFVLREASTQRKHKGARVEAKNDWGKTSLP